MEEETGEYAWDRQRDFCLEIYERERAEGSELIAIGRVDHHRLGNRCHQRKAVDHPRGDALLAPSFLAVVEHLGRAVFRRGVAPAQAIAIDEYYATHNTPIIHPRLDMALGKKRPKPFRLCVR